MNRWLHTFKRLTYDKLHYLLLLIIHEPRQIKKRMQERAVLTNNLQLKNIYKGKRCFIIGNGSSVKKLDLTTLKDEFTFVVNHFFLHKKYNKIHPNFYCMIDPRFAKNDKFTKDFFSRLGKKIHQDTLLFYPVEGLHLKKTPYLKKIKKAYMLMNHEFDEELKFNLEIDKPIPYLINVLLACLIPAIYLGFSEIYLLGCEHDWCKYRTNEDWGYFYKFKKSYNPNMYVPYETKLDHARKLFQAYRLIKKKFPKVKIYNCTPGSYLDVFEFKKFSKITSTKV